MKPWALVTTVTPLMFAVFRAPEPAVPTADAEAVDGVPLPAPPLEDELEHAVEDTRDRRGALSLARFVFASEPDRQLGDIYPHPESFNVLRSV